VITVVGVVRPGGPKAAGGPSWGVLVGPA
jgi:hypothetical protein